jgi:hypothetical protein
MTDDPAYHADLILNGSTDPLGERDRWAMSNAVACGSFVVVAWRAGKPRRRWQRRRTARATTFTLAANAAGASERATRCARPAGASRTARSGRWPETSTHGHGSGDLLRDRVPRGGCDRCCLGASPRRGVVTSASGNQLHLVVTKRRHRRLVGRPPRRLCRWKAHWPSFRGRPFPPSVTPGAGAGGRDSTAADPRAVRTPGDTVP